jgi:hypothetical protein
MTQQYIAGEFSLLLSELPQAPEECASAVRELRLEVESCPLSWLPRLASDAAQLTDLICWAALDRGDTGAFSRSAKSAVALREFAANASLLP